MTRRPIHGETGGAGTFDYHADSGDVVEIDAVPAANVVLLETGTLTGRDTENGLQGDNYVHLDERQLTELIGELTKARDFLREQLA